MCSDKEEDQDSPKLSKGHPLENRIRPQQQVRSKKALGKRKAEYVNVCVEGGLGTGTKRRKARAMEHGEVYMDIVDTAFFLVLCYMLYHSYLCCLKFRILFWHSSSCYLPMFKLQALYYVPCILYI